MRVSTFKVTTPVTLYLHINAGEILDLFHNAAVAFLTDVPTRQKLDAGEQSGKRK